MVLMKVLSAYGDSHNLCTFTREQQPCPCWDRLFFLWQQLGLKALGSRVSYF